MIGVSIIVCTKRPWQLHNVLQNYRRQYWRKKELIIILNNPSMKVQAWRRNAGELGAIRIYKKAGMTLGACLNFGITQAKYPIIAKFDDDDYYAPEYTAQAVQALISKRAAIVGKKTNLTYFSRKKLLAVRRPHYENCYLSRIAVPKHHLGGGTMVWRRNLYPLIPFRRVNLGEDIHFQRDCLRMGLRIYATDKRFYVSIRSALKFHTWKDSDEKILKECNIIGRTENYKAYAGK